MGLFDKAKDLARKNPDKVESALDKVGDAFDKHTGGKHAKHTDTAQQKAGEFLTGRTADAPGAPDAPGGTPGPATTPHDGPSTEGRPPA
ncbi:antitoxin [Dietzia sp. ANT_WB102]|uniref:antitoxin n=1 Tax=Dietzia sp. ANT_WB102 TaxID=2597345 RepID=UPI0011EE80DE|nr:antitoxin [Dietzia sp. ANT_WB102]KAA0918671.1 antitoxin [Dietzia sp. ANT_WB102]